MDVEPCGNEKGRSHNDDVHGEEGAPSVQGADYRVTHCGREIRVIWPDLRCGDEHLHVVIAALNWLYSQRARYGDTLLLRKNSPTATVRDRGIARITPKTSRFEDGFC